MFCLGLFQLPVDHQVSLQPRAWPYFRVCRRNFAAFLHSARSPSTSFKLPHTVTYSSISLMQALPIPALTDRPPPCMRRNMELFHPVRSCTHLFSMSKTQGLRGVMIGFLLCNLLEFSLSHQQESTMLSFTHTHGHTHMHTLLKGIYTNCRHAQLSFKFPCLFAKPHGLQTIRTYST